MEVDIHHLVVVVAMFDLSATLIVAVLFSKYPLEFEIELYQEIDW